MHSIGNEKNQEKNIETKERGELVERWGLRDRGGGGGGNYRWRER